MPVPRTGCTVRRIGACADPNSRPFSGWTAKLRAMNSPVSHGPDAGELPELAFVLAPRQNLFFHELVEALRDEAQAAGARTSLHIGNFPAPRPDLIYVLVPPHEYFTLMHGRIGPPPRALRRTMFICAEQPGTKMFYANVALAPRGGAVFDINRHAVAEFATALPLPPPAHHSAHQ